ncbi:MAG: hypothetical protein EXR77_18115 [Myxococcales bacterium]|nr:hypothetical protein [Myxococcales bacterium]
MTSTDSVGIAIAEPRQRLLSGLFFLSGATSLGFELIWSKQLAVVLGGSTAGIAFVVALFMGGMAIGDVLGGRFAARLRRPLLAYGLFELVMGAWGMVAILVLPHLEGSLPLPLCYVTAGALLLPCTVLAGMTLPVLAAATHGSLGAALGRLYAINTLGAVLGVLTTGMYLMGALGLRGAGALLTGLCAAVALLALTAGRRLPLTVVPQVATAERVSVPPAAAGGLWLVLAAATGMASLGAEILWTRALIAQFNASTYAFAAILAVFLLGLALGAAAAARALAKGADPLPLLVRTQLAAAVLVMTSPAAIAWAEQAIVGYVGIRHIAQPSLWWSTMAVGIGRALVALLLPATLLGCALPLLVDLYSRHGHDRGRSSGWVLAANSAGSVVGSLVARFTLLPLLGVSTSLRGLALVHTVIAAAALLAWGRQRGTWLVLAAVAALTVSLPTVPPFLGRLASGQRLIFSDEGVQDTTAIVQMDNRGGARQIISNGIAYAGDAPSARRYMRLLGHLPALYARDHQRALVICLGTGMTAAAVARHQDVQLLDLVDISPVVHRTLPLFDHVNDRVYAASRAVIHLQDGRVFLAHAQPASYDIITLEPPPPRVSGVSSLYSLQFYHLSQRALKPGGAIAQWLPVHGMTLEELKMLARTFVQAFPQAMLIQVLDVEAALVAVRGDGADAASVAQRQLAPLVAEHLRSVGVADVRKLPTMQGDKLRSWLGTGPIVTDDDPRIEQFAASLAANATDTDEASKQFFMNFP